MQVMLAYNLTDAVAAVVIIIDSKCTLLSFMTGILKI